MLLLFALAELKHSHSPTTVKIGNTCDKIIEKYDLRLSGTMVLPMALVRQTYRFYELVPTEDRAQRAKIMAETTERRLRESIDRYLDQ